MNYSHKFYGQPALPSQPMIEAGKLSCVYTGKVFEQTIVDAYNRYTVDFNRSSDRATQEFFLDQRFNFIHALMRESLDAKRATESKTQKLVA